MTKFNKGSFAGKVGLIGLLMASSIAISTPSASAQSGTTQIDISVYIGTSATNVRTGPGTKNSVAGVYQPGREVHIYERRGDWARISAKNDAPLWVYSPLLVSEKPATKRSEAIPAKYQETASKQESSAGKAGRNDKQQQASRNEPEARTPAPQQQTETRSKTDTNRNKTDTPNKNDDHDKNAKSQKSGRP